MKLINIEKPCYCKQKWFKKHRHHKVSCEMTNEPMDFYQEGYLINLDIYSILLRKENGNELLIDQAPGMIFECIDCNKKE